VENSYVIKAENVSRSVPSVDGPQPILKGCGLWIARGGLTAIVGPSGAGKTSLLYCLSGLDRPDTGRVWVDDVDLYSLGEESRSRFIRRTIGFVFQQYNLIPYLSVDDNIRLPLSLDKKRVDERLLDSTLERFGLSGRRGSRVSVLSGGEQQRAALCRAIVTQPGIIFADEPTGALDTANTSIVLNELRRLADTGRTVVMVTHDVESASCADQVVFMRDGCVVNVAGRLSADQISHQMARLGGDHGV